MKSKAIIVDLDGTLCDIEHRVHYVRSKPKNWKAFNESMALDGPYLWCLELVAAMRARGYKVFFVTGRDDDFKVMTTYWLKRYHVEYDELYMRKSGDFREDSEIKEEIYKQKIECIAQVLFVVDDRKSVVERWRKLGLTCLQCAPGDF